MTDEEVAEAMRQYRGRGRITLRELLDPYGVNPQTRSQLVTEGLVREAEGKRAPHGAVLVDADEAERIVRAAIIAAAISLSIVYVLRVLARAGGG